MKVPLVAMLGCLFWVSSRPDQTKTVFGCLSGAHLTGPKKASKPTILHNRLNKGKTPGRLVDVANLATCCDDDYDVLLEVWEPWANAMLVVLLPKLWFWIENHDWHNCFWMSSWGSPLLDPKKLQNEQFYIIDWIWKKLLVDVANLATCCHDDYDVLLEVLGTLRKCYVSIVSLVSQPFRQCARAR